MGILITVGFKVSIKCTAKKTIVRANNRITGLNSATGLMKNITTSR